MRQAFQKSSGEAATSSSQVEETCEPAYGKDTEVQSSSPPRVTCSHQQHLADYVQIFMVEGEKLNLGEDWVVPLIMEVALYFPI